MANLIQIKRSNTASTPANTLNGGELAYSYNSNSLFIGAQTGTSAAGFKIGGWKYNYLDQVGNPGVQTANAAVVLDANAYHSNVYTQGLVIQTSGSLATPFINSISNTANSTQLGSIGSLGSGNELVTTSALVTYISGRTGAAVGANGQLLFNNSGIVTSTATISYDYTTGAISIGNTSVNVQIGYVSGGGEQMQHWHGNANTYMQVQMTNGNTGSSASTDYIVNADNYTDTSNYVDLGINGSGWSNTQWTINGADDGYLYAANGTMAIGTASAKPVQFFTNGTLITNEVMRLDAGANVGIGNTNPNARLQVTGTANVSGAVRLGSTLTVDGVTNLNGNLTISATSGLSVNGSYGTAGQVLVSNGSALYWGTGTSGANTQVQFNDNGVANASAAFTFNKVSNTLTVANLVTTASSNVVNTTLSGTFTNVTSTTTTIGGTTTTLSSNVTITGANIQATSSTFNVQNINVSGNLVVSGSLTAIDSTTIQTKDNMIQFADQQANTTTFLDAVDTGFYVQTGNTSTAFYSGLARIAALSTNTNPLFKLFATSTAINTSIVDTGSTLGTLQAYLNSSALVSNSTVVNITANSTVSVALVANSLTLTTPLAAVYGGTGQNTYSSGDILVANTGNVLNKLSLGTAGYILQSNGSALVYSTLDGGTF
jgi:hypothetical protein